MGEIVNLKDYRPHITIPTDGDIVYNLDESEIIDFIEQKGELSPEVLRAIVSSWLDLLYDLAAEEREY